MSDESARKCVRVLAMYLGMLCFFAAFALVDAARAFPGDTCVFAPGGCACVALMAGAAVCCGGAYRFLSVALAGRSVQA
jgi:hypothetical protein